MKYYRKQDRTLLLIILALERLRLQILPLIEKAFIHMMYTKHQVVQKRLRVMKNIILERFE